MYQVQKLETDSIPGGWGLQMAATARCQSAVPRHAMIHDYIHVYIYIYIYRERERYVHIHVYPLCYSMALYYDVSQYHIT